MTRHDILAKTVISRWPKRQCRSITPRVAGRQIRLRLHRGLCAEPIYSSGGDPAFGASAFQDSLSSSSARQVSKSGSHIESIAERTAARLSEAIAAARCSIPACWAAVFAAAALGDQVPGGMQQCGRQNEGKRLDGHATIVANVSPSPPPPSAA